jgi:hypothetical protein
VQGYSYFGSFLLAGNSSTPTLLVVLHIILDVLYWVELGWCYLSKGGNE